MHWHQEDRTAVVAELHAGPQRNGGLPCGDLEEGRTHRVDSPAHVESVLNIFSGKNA
jgi:hypothetical protein